MVKKLKWRKLRHNRLNGPPKNMRLGMSVEKNPIYHSLVYLEFLSLPEMS